MNCTRVERFGLTPVLAVKVCLLENHCGLVERYGKRRRIRRLMQYGYLRYGVVKAAAAHAPVAANAAPPSK